MAVTITRSDVMQMIDEVLVEMVEMTAAQKDRLRKALEGLSTARLTSMFNGLLATAREEDQAAQEIQLRYLYLDKLVSKLSDNGISSTEINVVMNNLIDAFDQKKIAIKQSSE